MFVGRERELQFFEDKYKTDGGQLIVLYGRRRVGKTETLRKFSETKPHIYYSCREFSDAQQLASFSGRLLDAGSPAARYINTFPDWETAFRSLLELPTDGKKKLIIIDEFPYMCKGNSAIPSILQILWDEEFKKSNIMIILCGSSMSFMEKEILSEKNPLYGRATGVYKMNELPFDDAIRFFPTYSDEDKMLAYAILGGIPHYLQQFNPAISLYENIARNVLTKGCVLYSEVEFLIRQELREPSLYNTVIQAVALGNTRLNDIFTKTQIDKSKISVYLKNLIELNILKREFSVLSSRKDQATSTRGLYRITDNFFAFWYKFVFDNLSDLEGGDVEGVLNHVILPQINDFASPVFEAVCIEYLRKKSQRAELPFRISKLGRWWGKLNKVILTEDDKQKLISVDSEVDIIAVDAKSEKYILGECKFRNIETDITDLKRLMEKAAVVGKPALIFYVLFSKSAFSKRLSKMAKGDESIKLITLSDIVAHKS